MASQSEKFALVIAQLRLMNFDLSQLTEEDINLIKEYIATEMDPVTALILDCACHEQGSCFLCRRPRSPCPFCHEHK